MFFIIKKKTNRNTYFCFQIEIETNEKQLLFMSEPYVNVRKRTRLFKNERKAVLKWLCNV